MSFLIELDVPGWEARHTTFARIPDLEAVTQGRPTRFGMTNHMDAPPEEAWAIARRLGLTTCRRFTNWYRHHPGPGVFKLDELEKELEAAERHGIDVWLCIYDPPAFAQPGKVSPIDYRAFDFREDVWREFVATATQRLQGKFIGWEWLNEITPGGCSDPVGTYLSMCRIGTETAKQIDPNLITILAGGLYPRSFRLDMLRAGVGQYIDVMPVHYQNGNGILEARGDLNVAGFTVWVWEDESGRGRNAWGVPPREEIQATDQATGCSANGPTSWRPVVRRSSTSAAAAMPPVLTTTSWTISVRVPLRQRWPYWRVNCSKPNRSERSSAKGGCFTCSNATAGRCWLPRRTRRTVRQCALRLGVERVRTHGLPRQ